ncbi:MAG: peptide ABC transporter substrate-binding protein [Clostridia bacterium]|nr:peptide ABC transporter substrate-binding protein [Clostridia bacterium]
MKKIVSLVLCLFCILAVIPACSSSDDEEDVGATVPVYFSTEVANFDPAYANFDDATLKVYGLIYEGLFKYDSKGKVVKAQAKNVKILDKPSDDFYCIEITLEKTAWSDGIAVQAADYIYAWKRLLNPNFTGEGSSLLFDIKNARECMNGECSIDDLGVTDSGMYVLRIEFEGPTDYNRFYEYLASPLLVPLREVAVNKVAKDWSSSQSIVVCNGPFCVRTYNHKSSSSDGTLVLERNIYYKRNVDKDSVKKYVTPYRLAMTSIGTGSTAAEAKLAEFENGTVVYDSEIPLSKRAEYANKVTKADNLSVLSYIFNTTVAPFDKPEVRQALSVALDRQAIADIIVYAKPATGLIADKVFYTGYSGKASFRSKCGDLIGSSADLSKAKSLLSSAGVSGETITITLRNNEVDVAVAEYVKSVWEQLGLKVKLNALDTSTYKDELEYDLVTDNYLEAYRNGDFQVISVDFLMYSTDAFPTLASFDKDFAGTHIDMSVAKEEYDVMPRTGGYDSQAFNAKIEEAFAAKDSATRAGLLCEAEKILIEDMPIMPLAQLQTAYVASKEVNKSIKLNYFGFYYFEKVKYTEAEPVTAE